METIIALSTASGHGAISIVRMSGDNAIDIINQVFVGKDLTKVDSHTINYGKIYDKEEYIDEVLVSIFRAPKTYTKEDVVEVNCHGSMFVAEKIMEILIEKGARIANPGEFTKRAFLNGRIDLTQAEAVMDVINSQTETSLKFANVAIQGEVYKLIKRFRDKLLNCIAKVEVNIDYPEYEDELIVTDEYLKPILLKLKEELEEILEKTKTSKYIREGISTAIIGQPNVGKSSLLNALLREDKAIVTNIAGTTRDIVEGKINVGGLTLKLIDTAGVRETIDEVERIGVEKTKKVLQDAELVILMLDNNKELNDIDIELLELTKEKTRIIVLNKKDLEKRNSYSGEAVEISLLDSNSANVIEKEIKKKCNISNINSFDATYIGNVRQITKIKEALKSINEALEGINFGYPVDMINVDITNAWNSLGEIIGEGNPEELINNLFTNFCLGK